jgi:hypothetical protein
VQGKIFLVKKVGGSGLTRQATTITFLVAIRVFTAKVIVLADCPSLLWENSFRKILWEIGMLRFGCAPTMVKNTNRIYELPGYAWVGWINIEVWFNI